MTLDLRLRRTEIPIGTPLVDDWCVTLDGYTIGRILRTRLAGNAWTWCWYLHLLPNSADDRGDAETLDDAKAAFRRRAEARLIIDGDGDI